MANFAVAASPETIEKANKIMEIYAQNGDKKEDTLLRILDLAEAESVKGTHPALEPNLKAIEKTLGSLLKQINGIVAGQDIQLAEAKAIRERNDARAIANEKTASNDLLLKQMSDMKESLSAYKSLQEQYKSLQDNFASLQADLKAKNTELSNQKKEFESSLNAAQADFERQKETLQIQAALATEQAVIAKERELHKEYQEQLRQADKENAKLSIQIEQLQKHIEKLSNKINDSKKEPAPQ